MEGDFALKTIMNNWVNQAGYPVIHVETDTGDGTAEITQERFLSYKLEESEEAEKNKYMWYVPLNYAIEGEANFDTTSPQLWLTPSREKLRIQLFSSKEERKWVIFNKQQTGNKTVPLFLIHCKYKNIIFQKFYICFRILSDQLR